MKGFNVYQFSAVDAAGNKHVVYGEANNPYCAFQDAKRKNRSLTVTGGGRLVRRSY